MGDNIESKKQLIHALEVSKNCESSEYEGRACFSLATLLKKLGDNEDARDYFKASIIKLGQTLDDLD